MGLRGKTGRNDHPLILVLFMMAVLPMLAQTQSTNEMIKGGAGGGTKTKEEALKLAVESTVQFNTDELQKVLPIVLKSFDNLPKMSKESATQTCQSEFSNIDYNLKDAVRYLSQNDIRSVGVYLTSCRFVFCKEAFTNHNLPLPPQFSTVERQLHSHIHACLSLLSSTH